MKLESLKSIINTMDRVSEFCKKVGIIGTGLCALGFFICILIQVINRSFIHAQLLWTADLAKMLMIVGTFIGGSVVLKEKSLISLTFVKDALPPKAKKWLQYLVDILVIIFLLVFIWYGFESIPVFKATKIVSMPIDMSIPAYGVLFGGVLMLVQAINQLAQNIGCKYRKD